MSVKAPAVIKSGESMNKADITGSQIRTALDEKSLGRHRRESEGGIDGKIKGTSNICGS